MPRVLIVDDDRGFGSLLTRLCEEEGCESVAVGTAEEALYSLENHTFDLAIIDLHLPGKSGAELAWALRRHDRGMALMAVSANLDEWDSDDLADLGFLRVLAKPVDLADLRAAIRGLCGRAGAAEEIEAPALHKSRFRKGVQTLGELLLGSGLATQAQIDAALLEQERRPEDAGPFRRLGEILVDQGVLTRKQLTGALAGQEIAAEIRIREVGEGICVVDLRGYMDAATHAVLADALHAILEAGVTRMLLNCTDLEYADASGIGDILEYAKKVRDAGGDLKLLGLHGVALAVFGLLEMDGEFDAYDSEDEAVASFGP